MRPHYLPGFGRVMLIPPRPALSPLRNIFGSSSPHARPAPSDVAGPQAIVPWADSADASPESPAATACPTAPLQPRPPTVAKVLRPWAGGGVPLRAGRRRLCLESDIDGPAGGDGDVSGEATSPPRSGRAGPPGAGRRVPKPPTPSKARRRPPPGMRGLFAAG
jgi:hypothetical protein